MSWHDPVDDMLDELRDNRPDPDYLVGAESAFDDPMDFDPILDCRDLDPFTQRMAGEGWQ